jgi:hypothetical protein
MEQFDHSHTKKQLIPIILELKPIKNNSIIIEYQ